jgi:hypothetical protein
MGESPPWEATSHSASQEITQLLWNQEVHCNVHKSPPLVPILSQMHPVHTFPPCFPKSHSNIIIPSMPRNSEWSLPFRFSDEYEVCIYHPSHTCYIPLPSQPPWFDHPNNISWSSSLCSLHQPPTTSSLLGSNIHPSTLLSNHIWTVQIYNPAVIRNIAAFGWSNPIRISLQL